MKETTIFSPALETKFVNPELWGKIEQLNLNLIRDRMIIKYEWSEERTDNAIKSYRQYLYLTQVFEKPISPTRDIDEIWHQHILHTNKYALDCQKVFNKFLHHFPTPSNWKQVQQSKKLVADSSFCCDNKDCCNDDPRVDVKVNSVTMTADCKVTGCEGRCSNDSCDSGTTNDGKTIKAELKVNFDAPVLEEHEEASNYSTIVKRFFYNSEFMGAN